MNILVVGLTETSYQYKRLKEEGEKRGHLVDQCQSFELVIYASTTEFEPTVKGKPLQSYDLIYLCTIFSPLLNKHRLEWLTAVRAIKKQTVIVNRFVLEDPTALFQPANYFTQYSHHLPFPKSVVFSGKVPVAPLLDGFTFPVVLKTDEGSQGKNVFMAKTLEEAEMIIRDIRNRTSAVIIREFIPNEGDIRIFTVGYKAVVGLWRIAKPGEFRTNIRGGDRHILDKNTFKKVKGIAEKLSRATKIEISGLDIMLHKDTGIPYILEINVGPQMRLTEKYTNVNLASKIIEYFEKRVANPTKKA